MIKQEKITVDLKKLKAPERNVRMHPERQIKEIIKSLDKFGQCRDIVIDEYNTVLAGNGLCEAMKRRGDIKADAVRLIGLSEKEKLKFMLADNKTFALGVDDLESINDVIASLGDDLDVPGYDEETLKMIVATAEDVTDKIMRYGIIDESEINEIKVNGERKESYIEKFQNNVQNSKEDSFVSNNISLATSDLPLRSIDNEQPAEVGKYVICPKCGEKIWL